jgi:hypothetical protein
VSKGAWCNGGTAILDCVTSALVYTIQSDTTFILDELLLALVLLIGLGNASSCLSDTMLLIRQSESP